MTAHKAKGLEFDYVQLGDDFFSVLERDPDDQIDEFNLSYVAVTRAKKGLFLNKDLQKLLAAEGDRSGHIQLKVRRTLCDSCLTVGGSLTVA